MTMIVIQRINNNVLYVTKNDTKMIVMGRGIGFQTYPNDIVDPEKIEKTFILKNDVDVNQFASMVDTIPQSIIDITYKIIEKASKKLGKTLNSNLIIVLSDHINFAIKRLKKGMILRNPLQWEIKQIYPSEVKAGIYVLKVVEEELGISFPEEEAISLAMHFVNAQYGDVLNSSLTQIIPMIVEVTNIIKYHFQIELDEESVNFMRFVTHLRYYLVRNLNNTNTNLDLNDTRLLEMAILSYPKEYACATKIMNYFHQLYGWEENEDEKLYLVLHIHRVISRVDE